MTRPERFSRSLENTLLLDLLRAHAAPITGRLLHGRECATCALLGAHRVDVPAARRYLVNR